MNGDVTILKSAVALVVVAAVLLSSCGGEAPPAAPPAPAAEAVPVEPVAGNLETTDATWTPEATEELVAPVALYPDAILGQVLVASTNPQEVLDAGSWRLKNENLEGNALDDAAKKMGFTPPVRVLVLTPEVLDMMCSELGWTTELGQAYVNDQSGVLEAVQRLRFQARDAGNLVTSDRMVVASDFQEDQQVIILSSPEPEVVYVPQYDPVTTYAPVETDKGHSTATVVATAALAFGAGLLVANIFDDDDDDWYEDDDYYPRYYGRPMPYYAPYPYRPVYGGGYYASTGYVRPPNYRYSYNSSTVVVHRDTDLYWNRYDDRSFTKREVRNVKSPITRAKPNRPELGSLNKKAEAGPRRRAPAKPDKDNNGDARAAAGERRPGDADRGRASSSEPKARKADKPANQPTPSKSDGAKRPKPSGGADRAKPKGGGGSKPKGGGGGGGGGKRGRG